MGRHRMSEKEKMYFFVILFPPLWPLGLAMLICDVGAAIWSGAGSLYRRAVGTP